MEQQQVQRKRRNLRSVFNGTAGKYFFMKVGTGLLSIIPFVLPAMICYRNRWICAHTQIVGIPLEFNGRAGELLKKMFVWGFFSIITLGIYGLFLLPIRFKQWKTANTAFGPVVM